MNDKILLIEDEANIANLLKINLTGVGFIVENAYDGEDGLAKVESFCPDLVVLDLRMPKMNGWEIFNKLKTEPKYKNIKVIILTASDQKDNREKAMSLKVEGFFSKPVELEPFLNKIKDLLKHNE